MTEDDAIDEAMEDADRDMDIDKIPLAGLQTAAHVIKKKRDDALAEWKAYRDTHVLKASAEKQRIAYLNGVLHGLGAATKEFELRCPIKFYGSGEPLEEINIEDAK